MQNHELLSLLIKSEKNIGIVATLHRFYGSNIKVKIGYTHKVCGMNIDEMQLSVRSWNALKRSGISTIGELIDLIMQDGLIKIRNLGKISISEIKTKLLMLGFSDLSETEKIHFFEHLMEHNIPMPRLPQDWGENHA